MLFNAEIESYLLSKLCFYSEEGIFILDDKLNYLWVNHSFEETIGFPADYLMGKPLSFFPIEKLIQNKKSLTYRILQSLQNTGYFQEDINCLNPHGIALYTNLTIWQIPYQQHIYFVGLLRNRDANATNIPQYHLPQLSYYNQFTGLPNRSVFISLLSEYLLDTYKQLVVVRFSIDHFDTISNALPDEDVTSLLKQLTQRIQNLTLNDLKMFAHFNLSDFAMFFEVSDIHLIRNELEQIINSCELPFTLGKDRFYLHLSMGVSHHNSHGEQADILLRAAEHALAYQERHGGDGIHWYTHQLNPNLLEDMKFKAQLRDAMNEQQFIPYYQPKFDLQTGQLVGFEALVRWQHPERGILEPQYFLQPIIESQLSYDLFCQMLLTVITDLNTWQQLNKDIGICINADASEFCQPTFVSFVKNLLSINPKCQNQLHIEVTESSLMSKNDQTTEIFNQLQKIGVLLALDDFGTGYASLSYLSYYNFDFLKIDKSFVKDIDTNATQLSIVKSIITLAKSLNMQVIAEGIEYQKQAEVLKQLGCEYAQGYYFGRPMDAQAATVMILEHLHQQ
ncbi:sensor domain-containing protein [Psychrobacter sp. I-STPA10]|uniref:sensor domain-containing protein n=1 Tax=Psychrobacter sp. I-STPA10 TaxID=2585769 RepID=UPI001E5C892D|nr:EAL domain-containing protein [Psychrobacter sp. I-STPA10]